MNLDRFGFKAKSVQKGNYWLYASLDFYDGIGSYGVRYHLEPGGEASFSPAGIKPETICQCTGIRDLEGTLIYENDIVKIRHCGAEGWFCQRGVVRYDNLHWYIAEDVNDWNDWWESWSLYDIAGGKLLGKLYDVYIIGNKFDKE